MGVRSASEIPHPYERDVEYLVQYKSLKGKWKTIFVTKDSLEALQVMGDAYKQNPTRLYRTLSQEVFAKGKEPVCDQRESTPRAEEERTHEDGEDKSADGGG